MCVRVCLLACSVSVPLEREEKSSERCTDSVWFAFHKRETESAYQVNALRLPSSWLLKISATKCILGGVCSGSLTCYQTQTDVAHQTCYHTKSQYTDTRPTSICTDNYNVRYPTWQLIPQDQFLSKWYNPAVT